MKNYLRLALLVAALSLPGLLRAQTFITATPGTNICAGTSVSFSTGFPGSTTTFQWMVNGMTVGSDSVFVSATLANGDTVSCIAGTDTDMVVMNVTTGIPGAGIISGAAAVCLGSSATLSDSVGGGMWMASNGAATVAGGVVTSVSAGIDTISYITANVCGADTVVHVMSVDTAISPAALTIVGTPTICAGTTVTLTDAVGGGIWSSNDTARAIVNDTGMVSLIHSGGDTIRYTITNACGSHSVWHFFDIHPIPHPSPITGGDSVCLGSTVTLHNAFPTGTWSSSDAANASISSTGLVTGLAYGTTTISYSISNACGSALDTLPFSVDIPALPIVGSPDLCQFSVGILLEVAPGGTWSVDNPLIAGPAIGGYLFGITPGTATITYSLTNACGTSTQTFEVTVSVCPASGVASVPQENAACDVYPNPSHGDLVVSINGAEGNIPVTISDLAGRQVLAATVAGNASTTLHTTLPDGIYLVTAYVNGQKYVRKVTVQQ